MTRGRYELTFWGEWGRFPRYRRWHSSFEEAEATAYEVFARLEARGIPRAAHPAIVYGPGLGPDGRTISGYGRV